jgi:hypothetical protein
MDIQDRLVPGLTPRFRSPWEKEFPRKRQSGYAGEPLKQRERPVVVPLISPLSR